MNTEILKQFSKYTFLAYKEDKVINNNTVYSDTEIKNLLNKYDIEFKKPLKRMLIEYYRLKFNPKIKMQGEILEQLGFKSCSYCYDETPINQNIETDFTNITVTSQDNKKGFNFNWKFILNHADYLNQLFSTYHEFSEDQLIKLKSKLFVGYINSIEFTGETLTSICFGLIFNKYIKWSKSLQELYYEKPMLVWAGDGTDEYSYEINFSKLPHSLREQAHDMRQIADSKIIRSLEYSEEKDAYEYMNSLLIENKNFYTEIIMSTDYSSQSILSIIENNQIEYITNQYFYNKVLHKIRNDISDFSVVEFYRRYDKKNN